MCIFKGLFRSSIKHTSAGMVLIDKLTIGFCLPLDISIKCLFFLCEPGKGTASFIQNLFIFIWTLPGTAQTPFHLITMSPETPPNCDSFSDILCFNDPGGLGMIFCRVPAYWNVSDVFLTISQDLGVWGDLFIPRSRRCVPTV